MGDALALYNLTGFQVLKSVLCRACCLYQVQSSEFGNVSVELC